MKLKSLKVLFGAFLIASSVGLKTVFADSSPIKDANLRSAINQSLDRDLNKEVTKDDLRKLKKLLAPANNIRSVEGLQYAENLEALDLSENQISDVSPLKNLQNISYLNLIHQSVEYKYDKNNLTPITFFDGTHLKLESSEGVFDKVQNKVPATYSFSLNQYSGVLIVSDKDVPKQKPYVGVQVKDINGQSVDETIKIEKARKDGSLKIDKKGNIQTGNSFKDYAILGGVVVLLCAGGFVAINRYKKVSGKRNTKLKK